MIAAVLLSAGLLASVSLDAEIKAVAALPGEPRLVSAAAVTPSDAPLLTIENPGSFEASAKRRLVIVGGLDGDERGALAVLQAVRWFKTRAPPAVRRAWAVSALPFADPAARRVWRWVAFQAPDLVVDVRGAEAATAEALTTALAAESSGLGPVRFVTTTAAASASAIRKALTAPAGVARSPLHDAVRKRVARDPLEIARVLARKYPEAPSISYIPAVAWTNTLRLATIDGDESLRAKVRQQTAPWLSGAKPLFGERIQLTAVAGTMIFAELAKADDDAAARQLAIEGAARASLRVNGVLQYRQGWTDDMFMATAILARLGAWPGRESALDTAVDLLIEYAGRLQRADGIFVHAADGPVAWGRGNGFAALGFAEALTALPRTHPLRSRVLEIYRRHVQALKARQAPDGMWGEVIDEPGSYRELTATAMILSAMARGVRLGWLDKTDRPIVERAWRALAAHIVDEGTLVDVCASTGAGPTKRYYLDRPAITGADDRGAAMALLASVEMYELAHNR